MKLNTNGNAEKTPDYLDMPYHVKVNQKDAKS